MSAIRCGGSSAGRQGVGRIADDGQAVTFVLTPTRTGRRRGTDWRVERRPVPRSFDTRETAPMRRRICVRSIAMVKARGWFRQRSDFEAACTREREMRGCDKVNSPDPGPQTMRSSTHARAARLRGARSPVRRDPLVKDIQIRPRHGDGTRTRFRATRALPSSMVAERSGRLAIKAPGSLRVTALEITPRG